MLKKNKKLIGYLLSLLLGLNILAWLGLGYLDEGGRLKVTVFDVGQGDAIFIETPERQQILIDGGPDDTVLERLNECMPFWDKTIDLIILTHPDSDHVTGLLSVLENYKVHNIIWTGIAKEGALHARWLELVAHEGAAVFMAQAGQKIMAGGVNLEVLYPFEDLSGREVSDINATSVILRLDFGATAFLFTGDTIKAVEKELIIREVNLKANVLKVAHHGSKTSTSEELVDAVLPELAVISLGADNSYGHPHEETLATLAKYDIYVLRTDQDGSINIVSDGNSLKIK